MTRLDAGEVGVGGGVGIGEHVLVVEDVEALVLHRAHVEVGHGDDHEDVEVVFAAEGLLVPAHRALERIHRVGAALLLAVLAVDAERDVAAGRGDEGVLDARRDRRRPSRTDRTASGTDRARPRSGGRRAGRRCSTRLPLERRTGRLGLRRLDARGVDREHVGPVEEIGDAAKAFRLALGATVAARPVEAHQLGVGGGIDLGDDLEREGPRRHAADDRGRSASRRSGRRAARSPSSATETRVSSSPSRTSVPAAPRSGRIASRAVTRVFAGSRWKSRFDGVDQIGGRLVVAQADGESLGFHRCFCRRRNADRCGLCRRFGRETPRSTKARRRSRHGRAFLTCAPRMDSGAGCDRPRRRCRRRIQI